MGLINNQKPNALHQSTYPEWYSFLSGDYVEPDFLYKYKIYTTDGIISTSKSGAESSRGDGYISPVKKLNDQLNSVFQPEITGWADASDSIINYYIRCEEFCDSLAFEESLNTHKRICMLCNKEDFDYEPFILNSGTESFLTDWSSTRKVSLDDYGTMRAISGNVDYSSQGSSSYSRLYELVLSLTKPNGDVYDYWTVLSNPYYSNVLSTGAQDIQDLEGWLVDFPCAPKNFEGVGWSLKYINGSPTVGFAVGNPVEVGDTYTLRGYTWPYGDNGRVSKTYNFECVERCDAHEPIQIHWRNQYGAFDFYTFNKVSTETETFNKKIYRKNREVIRDYEKGHNDYDAGLSVFDSNVDVVWKINSDWVTDEQIEDIFPLWSSPEVYAYIDSKWYPVVVSKDSEVKSTTQKGIRNIECSMLLSNKKYK